MARAPLTAGSSPDPGPDRSCPCQTTPSSTSASISDALRKSSGYDLDLEKAMHLIQRSCARRVGLQAPEGLKRSLPALARQIEELTGAEVIISGDPCFGACDLDLRLAERGRPDAPSGPCRAGRRRPEDDILGGEDGLMISLQWQEKPSRPAGEKGRACHHHPACPQAGRGPGSPPGRGHRRRCRSGWGQDQASRPGSGMQLQLGQSTGCPGVPLPGHWPLSPLGHSSGHRKEGCDCRSTHRRGIGD